MSLSVSTNKGVVETTPSIKVDSSDLYLRCKKKDEKAWAVIREICIRQALYMKFPQPEDVAQDVCMKLINGSMDKIKKPAAFIAYTRVMVTHHITSWYRKYNREEIVDTSPENTYGLEKLLDKAGRNSLNDIEKQRLLGVALQKIKKAAQKLPKPCADLVPLYFRYLAGLIARQEDIARILGVRKGSIGGLIRKCIGKLKL